MKIVRRINEGKLNALVEQVLSELDWRTYASAAEKRQKQADDAYTRYEPGKGYDADTSRYKLLKQAQDVFNKKHTPDPNDYGHTFRQSHTFDKNGNRAGTFVGHHYNPVTDVATDIQNGQMAQRRVFPTQDDYEVPADSKIPASYQEIADFQSGKSRYNRNTHQWESKVHAITSRVVEQLRESADKHVTPQRLHSLVEQALNELDWKTYMNAANKIAYAQRALDRGEYNNPVVLKTITRALAKKFGAKKARMLMDGFSNEQIEDLLNMMHRDLNPDDDLYHRRDDLENAATDAFARKHGHKRNVERIGDDEYAHDYSPSLQTIDPNGNVYDMEDTTIYTPDDGVSVQYFPDNEWGPAMWDKDGENEENAEELERLKNSDAMQDLVRYRSGESQYNKDNHQWESVAHRVTESVMRKLRGGINESQEANDTRWVCEEFDSVGDSFYIIDNAWTDYTIEELTEILEQIIIWHIKSSEEDDVDNYAEGVSDEGAYLFIKAQDENPNDGSEYKGYPLYIHARYVLASGPESDNGWKWWSSGITDMTPEKNEVMVQFANGKNDPRTALISQSVANIDWDKIMKAAEIYETEEEQDDDYDPDDDFDYWEDKRLARMGY